MVCSNITYCIKLRYITFNTHVLQINDKCVKLRYHATINKDNNNRYCAI